LGRAIHAAELGQASPEQLARAAQLAEHDWAEVKCGIMDQMAISVGQPGEALLLDCRNLATRQVPVPGDWAVAIIQSGVTRGLVDGHYNARRQECEAAANALGVDTLRDATLEMVEAARLDPIIAARAHHVVSEIERTAQAVRALEDSDLANFGELLRQSHASLRDLFEVSVPAVDQLVALANKAIGSRGGARMTGGGFGGAVVAVVERDALPELVASVKSGFAAPDGKPLDILIEGKGSSSARNEL
jgi:galactokinase